MRTHEQRDSVPLLSPEQWTEYLGIVADCVSGDLKRLPDLPGFIQRHGRRATFELACELAEQAHYWLSGGWRRVVGYGALFGAEAVTLAFFRAAVTGDRTVAAERFWELDEAVESTLLATLTAAVNQAHHMAHQAYRDCRFGPLHPRMN